MLYCSWDMVCDGCNFYLLFWDIFCYAVSEIWCVMDVIIYFGLLFDLLPPPPPNSPKYQNFYKNKKKHMEISSFYTCITKIMIRWCTISEIWCAMNRQMDRQTDRQKKWPIEVGAPPIKISCKVLKKVFFWIFFHKNPSENILSL